MHATMRCTETNACCRASLYERPVNLEAAKKAHAEFRRTMRDAGLRVLTVRDILSFGVEDHMGARVELEDLATKALHYGMAEGTKLEDLTEKVCHYLSPQERIFAQTSACCLATRMSEETVNNTAVSQDRFYLTEEYKREVLEHMSIAQLIETIMINPTVHISPSYRDTGLSASYTFQPLSNLVYTRDQQITTPNGIIMGRLRSSQRQLEVDLMHYCFNKLGEVHVGAST